MKASIVVSVFNEQEVLSLFWDELKSIINNPNNSTHSFQVVFVNDGSIDNSPIILNDIAKESRLVTVVHFSRNFGHEAAMLAGIEHSTGDVIICMDSDLQHPPTCITEMIEKHLEGYEIVTMTRDQRADAGLMKRVTSWFFYWVINKLTKGQFEPNASDFFLISSRVANVITESYRERTRFIRGIIQTIGFKKTSINYIAPNRAAGNSKYSLTKLFFFSLSAIATFSHIPLRLGLALGLLFGLFSFGIGVYSLVMKFIGHPFSGYTTLVVIISFGFALLFIVIGIIGEYIGYIFNEVKNRPIYIVEKVLNEPTEK
jgi:dolichol-phosphate mannosyltransferase